ncbi:MAG: zinc ABC transporter substrate-binding protein [Verrucomicrobiales bacterium]|nr:zinc ABC transporter substrate-binding protein [Verrucomicrobiales bacterium]
MIPPARAALPVSDHPCPPGRVLAFLLLTASLVLSGCQRAKPDPSVLRIATTTSYLEAVAQDLLGADLQVVRLAEPGACPGHFDIRPSQVQELRQCRLLLRFDFQQSLDARLAHLSADGPHVVEVAPGGGLSRPDRYLLACRQAADHFVRHGLLTQTSAAARVETIAQRLTELARDATNQIARAELRGAAVLASVHQREFCEWLGLNVAATFRGADTAGIRDLETAIAAGKLAPVRLVIANRPEGRRTADALAARLGGAVVVLDNFPSVQDGGIRFDDLLRGNVAALIQGSVASMRQKP